MKNYSVGEYIGIVIGVAASIGIVKVVQNLLVTYVVGAGDVGPIVALGAMLAPFLVGAIGLCITFKIVNWNHMRVHKEEVIDSIYCNTRCDAPSCSICGNTKCPMHGEQA